MHRYQAVNTAREALKLANRAAMDAASDVKDLIERINAAPGTQEAIPVAKRTEARNRMVVLRKLAVTQREVSEAKAQILKDIVATCYDKNEGFDRSLFDTTLPDGQVAAWVIGVPVVPGSSRAVGFPSVCFFALVCLVDKSV